MPKSVVQLTSIAESISSNIHLLSSKDRTAAEADVLISSLKTKIQTLVFEFKDLYENSVKLDAESVDGKLIASTYFSLVLQKLLLDSIQRQLSSPQDILIFNAIESDVLEDLETCIRALTKID